MAAASRRRCVRSALFLVVIQLISLGNGAAASSIGSTGGGDSRSPGPFGDQGRPGRRPRVRVDQTMDSDYADALLLADSESSSGVDQPGGISDSGKPLNADSGLSFGGVRQSRRLMAGASSTAPSPATGPEKTEASSKSAIEPGASENSNEGDKSASEGGEKSAETGKADASAGSAEAKGKGPTDSGGVAEEKEGVTSSEAGSEDGNAGSDGGGKPSGAVKKKKKRRRRRRKKKTVKGAGEASGDTDPVARKAESAAKQLGDEAEQAEEAAENAGPSTARQRVAHLQSLKEKNGDALDKLSRDFKYLQKSVALRQSQSKASNSQVQLDEDEISVTLRQLKTIKEKDESTTARYKELKSKTRELATKALYLTKETDKVADMTTSMTIRLQQLSMEEVLANSARGLPNSVAGALRRSAEALTPFVDTLMVAADTNQRLVDHVGAEIDKYTHVNIRKSPFLSGILFYCVLLVPTLVIVSFVRRVIDSSSKLTVSHFVIFGNVYFIGICIVAVFSTIVMRQDPALSLHRHHEKVFITFNLLLSVYYLWHVSMLGLQSVYTRERRNVAQFVATLCVGIHYFLFTWRRVFTNSSPEMLAVNYFMYCTIFTFITVERVRRINMTLYIDRRLRSNSNQDVNKHGLWFTIQSLSRDLMLATRSLLSLDAGLGKGYNRSPWERREEKRPPSQRRSHSDDDGEFCDEEIGIDEVESRRPQSARYPDQAPTRYKRRQSARSPPRTRRNFASMFFGTPDEGRGGDSSAEEHDDEDAVENAHGGWWGTFGRVTGYARGSPGRARGNTGTRNRRVSGTSSRLPQRSARRAD